MLQMYTSLAPSLKPYFRHSCKTLLRRFKYKPSGREENIRVGSELKVCCANFGWRYLKVSYIYQSDIWILRT